MGWLDKLQDGAKFEGTTNKGFNYNGAWGGPVQNGNSMNYYKAGLDFQPKSISQNGDDILSSRQKRGIELRIKDIKQEAKERKELSETGNIKHPKSIAYTKNKKAIPEIHQETRSPQELKKAQEAMSNVHEKQLMLERPLLYAADPNKILGDVGVPGFEGTEKDREKIMLNRYNPYQSQSERLKKHIGYGMEEVPAAALNAGLATMAAGEASAYPALKNVLAETFNPIPLPYNVGMKDLSTRWRDIDNFSDAAGLLDNKGLNSLSELASSASNKITNAKRLDPNMLTESFKNPTFLQNITDLEDLNTFAKKYNYTLPENLNRIAKSDVLTDRATRGLVNRHNTFMRGVSTNWEHIEKTNPEILKYLESKGIDYANNPKEAAEYMATHIPFDTGYGRASLNNSNKHGLYSSNSLGTAEGYTYGEGYTVKAKRPTDFTSNNRQDWIKNNDFDVYEHSLPEYKEIAGWDGAAVANTSSKEEALKYLQDKLDKTTDKTQRFYIEKGLENIDKNYMDSSQLKTNVLKTEHHEPVPEDYLLDNVLDPHEFVKHDTELNKIKDNLVKEHDPRKQEIMKKQDDIFNKPTMSLEDEFIFNSLNKDLKAINRDVNKNVVEKHSDYLDKHFPGWKETLEPNAYAHYIHVGDPGTKVLEAVSSKKITPEIWKNKSRSHRGDYTPKLSKRKDGGWLEQLQDGGIIDDEMGQWNHPGKVTRIPSNRITMKGVDYPVLGVPNKGKSKMMYPGEEHRFPGASSVTEYPKGKNGVELDQLTNFTNYNTKQPGGWLDQL